MKILVVSNMFPDKANTSYGIFVKKFCDQLPKIGIEYETTVMLKGASKADKVFKYVMLYMSSFIKCLVGHYDVVYVHYASHSSLGVLLARKLKKFTIYTNLHGSDVVPEDHSQEKMQKYTKAILAKSEKIIVPSEYFRQLVSEKYKISRACIYVYPSGGIDTNIFYKTDKSQIDIFKNKYGINTELPVFGMAGRVSKDKGWDIFIDAVNKLDIDACFVIVGTGNEDEKMESKIQASETNVVWIRKLLHQDELSSFYNACDFFVFPTKRAGESLGLVAVEAMACGTPVIASDFAAPKYYVQDGVNGFKFDMGNEDSLKNAIEKAFSLKDEDKVKLQYGALKTSEQYNSQNLLWMFMDIFL